MHSEYKIVTSPLSHTLCGSLTYVSKFNDEIINEFSESPMAYDATTQTFTIYSENFELIGTHSITLAAHLTQYTEV